MIYFLRIKDMNNVKIGYTKSKSLKRLKAYNTHSPFYHELLLFIEGDLDKEKELHQLFKDSHDKREWFYLTEEILNFIDKNKTILPNSLPLNKDGRKYKLYSEDTKKKAFEMYSNGLDITLIAQLLEISIKKATKVCWDMGAKRPEKELKYPKGFHSKANKIAYNKKKYRQGKITLEELEQIIKQNP